MIEIGAPKPEKFVDLKLTNTIQLVLADQYYGFESDEFRLAWIKKYSELFREIITAYPELVVQFEKDQTGTLERFKDLLYDEQVA